MFGNQIWPPIHMRLQDAKIVKGTIYPMYFKSEIEMIKLIEGDIIYVSNPMFSSYGTAILKKLNNKNKIIVLDIDDWHIGWVLSQGLKSTLIESFKTIIYPDGFIYLLFMESLIGLSDEKTVVSRYLQNKYGGIYLPHFVDTDLFNSNKYDKEKLRSKWHIKNKKIISFIGTPRPHKGLEDLIKALKIIDTKNNIKIMMTGDINDKYVKYLCNIGKEKIIFLGIRPQNEEPIFLSMADLIVLPQRVNYFTMAQVPKKVVNAMSMAKPIISTNVSDIPEMIHDCGIIIQSGNIEELSSSILYLLDNDSISKNLGRKARKKCIEKYSLKSTENILYNMINRLITS